MGRGRVRAVGVMIAATGLAVACSHGLVPPKLLVDAFNGGVLEGAGDPWYSQDDSVRDAIRLRMRDELGDGYFGQGVGGEVALWLQELAKSNQCVEQYLANKGARAASVQGDGGDPKQERLEQIGCLPSNPPPFSSDVCTLDRSTRGSVLGRRADWVRFRTGLVRALEAAAAFRDERAATDEDVKVAANRAFLETARYLDARRWRRSWDRPVSGLVVKGGAATGIFSAGVVWVAMNVIHECMRHPDEATGCARGGFHGFSLVSGTSTGATIVGAVDAFQSGVDGQTVPSNPDQAKDGGTCDRACRIDNYLDWYLCSSMSDLYCIRDGSAVNLVRSEDPRLATKVGMARDVSDGLLDFTGLAKKASADYSCSEMSNGTELVLNTVDFRTGRLYSLSDQDPSTLRSPWDVTKAIIASAALPFIVRPIYSLPVDPFDGGGAFSYLDGGIRSELPVLALARRGAERVLVVSSDTSTTGTHAPLRNGGTMAIRYIDINTGGVTEAEVEHARRRAEGARLAEYEQCRREVAGATCPSCNMDAICSGDFARACTDGVSQRAPTDAIVRTTWRMENVWRDTRRVDGLAGYAFIPQEQRRLLIAGAEAAREHCDAILDVLGIPDDWREKARAWCVPALPSTNFCANRAGRGDGGSAPPVSKEPSYCANDDGPQPAFEERKMDCPHTYAAKARP